MISICTPIINAIEFVVRMFIEVVRTIVETVCGWVTTIVRQVIEVVKEVCSWLPWPLDELCELVTELVEVVTEVVEWVCEEVITTIIDIVEIILTVIIYVIRWICWVIEWPLRLIDIGLCMIGVRLPRTLHLCVKILEDNEGTPATTRERVDEIIARARELLRQCNINICLYSVQFVPNEDLLEGVECGASQFFSSAYPWFERNACPKPPFSTTKPLTVYFVDSMADANACTISRTSYIVATDGANGASIVHEFGHHADLMHHEDPQNIMFESASDTKDQLTPWQCCMMRSSTFVTQIEPCLRETRISLVGRIERLHRSYTERRKTRRSAD